MDVVSLCPLRVSSFVWQSRTGAYARTVIAKATFVLQLGESGLAPEQEPVCEQERSWDDNPRSSVHAPSDRAPYKARADVVLVGHAYAPGGMPVRSLVARMVIGEIDKSIEVWCDRGFRLHDGQLLEGQRFVKSPLRWERAAGGPETNNPVGLRFDAAPDRYGMVAIPNLQPIGMYVSQRSDTFGPVGFGPIAARWPGRQQKLGRHAGSFPEHGWEARPLPADFDYDYFNVAPLDQQVAELRANERIVLENLHSEHARLVTTLPGLRPRAIVDRATGEREEVALSADTLWIDTDRGVCTLVWRGSVGLRDAQEAGRIAVWLDGAPRVEPGRAVEGAPEVEPDAELVELDDEGEAASTMTILGLPMLSEGPALPFVPGTSRLAETDRRLAEDIARWVAASAGEDDGTGTMFAPMPRPGKKALPFEGVGEDHDDGDGAKTLPPLPRPGNAPVPFAQPVLPPMPALPPPVRFEEALAKASMVLELQPEAKAPSPWKRHDGMDEGSPEVPRPADIAPPPMIGPLAKGEVPSAPAEASPPKAEQAAPVPGPKPPEPEEPPVDLTIEKTATIAAELAEGKTERARILEAHGVREGAWKASETRWDQALEEEQGRGKSALRGAYDVAYTARVEKFRGPITLDEYAQIMVGLERGRANGVLDALKIQRPALMPIVRVWAKKVARDAKLGAEAAKALREAKRA
jgi:hypothetical protein